ncbi:hypothetical protein Tco_1009043 [Tanacetum coccineum]
MSAHRRCKNERPSLVALYQRPFILHASKRVMGRQNRGQSNNAWGVSMAGYGGALNRVRNVNLGQARQNGVALDEEQLLFIAGGQDNVVDKDVDEQPIQDLALNVDNVFQADDCNAFDFDVDEAPTTQTMFMANLSSTDPVYDEASLSYDSDILSEVHDHDHYQDAICEHHEEHEMHDDVQPNYVVDLHADYIRNSNMIPYDQYVKDNAVLVSISKTIRNIVVDNSLTAELETYKEQVELYERRARFELTEREQKIDEQLRVVITDPIVHNTKDTLEIAEITRKKIYDKMKDPECVTHKVKIAPPDYSKENYLATLTPQKQLTPEQIFWSQDIIKMKAKAVKEQTSASRPTKALTVYLPNTPATLVPMGASNKESSKN